MKKNYILVFLSIIISLFFLEIFLSFFLFNKVDYNYKNRYLIYSEGKVFKNIENFLHMNRPKRLLPQIIILKMINL